MATVNIRCRDSGGLTMNMLIESAQLVYVLPLFEDHGRVHSYRVVSMNGKDLSRDNHAVAYEAYNGAPIRKWRGAEQFES